MKHQIIPYFNIFYFIPPQKNTYMYVSFETFFFKQKKLLISVAFFDQVYKIIDKMFTFINCLA